MPLTPTSSTAQHTRSLVVLTSGTPADAARAVIASVTDWEGRGAAILTPGPLAARALGVPHRSLTDLAMTVLGSTTPAGVERGGALRFASALQRRAALQAAVADGWQTQDVVGTARSVEGSVRALLQAGAGVRLVAALEGLPRLSRLLELVEVYRQRLAAAGLRDRAEALWLAAEEEGTERVRMLVCGHQQLDAAELAFVAANAADGSVLVLPSAPAAPWPTAVPSTTFNDNEATAAALVEQGWQLLQVEASRPEVGPRLSGHRLPTLEAEVRFVLTKVKELLLQGEAAANIALVAADPRTYGPVAVAVGREYGVAVRPNYSVPLAATPVGYLVGAVAGVVAAGLPFEETARLLSHRLVVPLSAEAWDEARRRHPSGQGAWARLDARAALLAWPRRATRAQYVEHLQATIEGLGVPERLAEDVDGARQLELLVAALSGYAAGFEVQAEPQPQPTVDRALFIGELLDHLQLVSVRRDPEPGSGARTVELLGLDAMAGATLPHVFVLGATEGSLPARLDPGTRLDFVEREAALAAGLAVADAARAATSEAMAFDAVVRAARSSLTLSFCEAGDRSGQLASPYFAALGLTPSAPAAASGDAGWHKPAASAEELRRDLLAAGEQDSFSDDAVLAAARRSLAVESRREAAVPPDEYDGVIGEPYPHERRRFSATSLAALGQCTFKWFAGYALRLTEPQEADDELTPLVRGNLYHMTLELAVGVALASASTAGSTTTESVRAAVLAALPEAFQRAASREAVHTANWELRSAQHLAAIERVVLSDTFLPAGTEVIGPERRFGAGAGSPAVWRGFDVSGRIDRIDDRSGTLTLIDYKTSAGRPLGVQDASGEAKVDLQLPIYLEAAVPALGLASPGREGTARAEYYSLTKAAVIATTSLTGDDAFDAAALDSFAERAHAALDAGAYPVAPDRYRRACDYCSFDSICRVGPRVERKRYADG